MQRLPVPSADLGERIKAYVERLAAKAQPVMQGIGDGQALRVLCPLHDHADRATLTGFVPDEGNALLLTAIVHPEHLAERLTQGAVEGSMPASERDQGLQALQHELTGLRYQEEASICAAISNGEEVSRTGSQPPWAVLMVQVEHELEAAA